MNSKKYKVRISYTYEKTLEVTAESPEMAEHTAMTLIDRNNLIDLNIIEVSSS